MAQIFQMPQLGSTMEEGTILKWFKQEGDPITQGELLLEVETDKASMEVESPSSGIIRRILVPADRMVAIRIPIAILGEADEPIDHLLAQAGHSSTPVSDDPGSTLGRSPTPASSEHPNTGTPEYQNPAVPISPRARRLADSQGVPVSALAGRGSGPGGRVIERDVAAYVAERDRSSAFAQIIPEPEDQQSRITLRSTPLAARMAGDLGVDLNDLALGLPGSRVRSVDVLRHAETGGLTPDAAPPSAAPSQGAKLLTETDTLLPFSGMRKRIADNVAKSAFTAPHVTLTLEVDMTACADFRSRLIPAIELAYGARLSYTDILVKASAHALGEHPRLNATLSGDQLRVFAHKNIGVAVALDEGLIVPVIRQAESKTLGTICAELKPLIERSRTGKFTPDDLAGGTFTITNLGAFGIDVFDPIIVTGQAAILGVGRIADKPVVIDKEIVVRSMMNLCLSFDHRMVDGAPAAKFLQRLKQLLENPIVLLV